LENFTRGDPVIVSGTESSADQTQREGVAVGLALVGVEPAEDSKDEAGDPEGREENDGDAANEWDEA
jgi:hypothetical protein